MLAVGEWLEGLAGSPSVLWSEARTPRSEVVASRERVRRCQSLRTTFKAPVMPMALRPDSTFHHFADYNWEPAQGCPSFVSEPCGDGMRRNPEARRDAEARVSNLARWLLPA